MAPRRSPASPNLAWARGEEADFMRGDGWPRRPTKKADPGRPKGPGSFAGWVRGWGLGGHSTRVGLSMPLRPDCSEIIFGLWPDYDAAAPWRSAQSAG